VEAGVAVEADLEHGPVVAACHDGEHGADVAFGGGDAVEDAEGFDGAVGTIGKADQHVPSKA
jgi:hypothetical protein